MAGNYARSTGTASTSGAPQGRAGRSLRARTGRFVDELDRPGRHCSPSTSNGHALDLPGFGRSEPIDGYDFRLATHARVVIGYIESLGPGPVHLFGNSMGGAITLMVASAGPTWCAR